LRVKNNEGKDKKVSEMTSRMGPIVLDVTNYSNLYEAWDAS